MSRRLLCITALILTVSCMLAVEPSDGAVHLVEDEVYFTLLAPGAKSVYLVGTFNNWNPTVEPMDREGDTFTAALFLAPDEYHYKFVVDGTWISDPDNPPREADAGSPLALVERGGVLTIKAHELEQEGAERAFIPEVRYRGTGISDDDRDEVNQEIDLTFTITNEHAVARALLKSRDRSWHLSPLDADILLDRGSLELKTANGRIIGFENDSLWTSRDPFNLFGAVGVHAYDFGFGRRGVALEQTISKVQFRAVYSDRSESAPPGEPVLPSDSVAVLLNAPASGRRVYRAVSGLEGADAFGGELYLDTGDFSIGYGRRENRGMNAGMLAAAVPDDSLTGVDLFNTVEYWRGAVYWLGAKLPGALRARIGYGSGVAEVLRLSRTYYALDQPRDLRLSAGSEPAGGRTEFQRSERWTGSLEYAHGRFEANLWFGYDRFEYLEPLYVAAAEAEIVTACLDAAYAAKRWNAVCGIEVTDQEYGDTPRIFHHGTHQQNYWLDYDDRLTVERMTGFELGRYTIYSAAFSWNRGGRSVRLADGKAGEQSFSCRTACVAKDLTGGVRYLSLQAFFERFLMNHLFLQMDGRLARYPSAAWSGERTFFAPYIEAGYRSGRMELSLGFGFDPVVFSSVQNEYISAGRLEFLRAAGIAAHRGARADDAGGAWSESGLAPPPLIEYNLLQRENLLEEDTTLKLEWIIVF